MPWEAGIRGFGAIYWDKRGGDKEKNGKIIFPFSDRWGMVGDFLH